MILTLQNPLTRFLKVATLVASASALFAVESHAAIETIEYTETKTSSLTDWAHAFELAKFNVAGGTLLSVEFIFTIDGTTNLTVTNNGDSSTNGSASTKITLSIAPSDLFPLDPDAVPDDGDRPYFDPYITVVSDARNFTNLTAGETRALTARTFTGSGSRSYTDAPTLAVFSGPGTINLSLGTFTETVVSVGGGNASAAQSTQAGGTVTVKYTYEAIPEPGTWAALAMGAGVLAFSARFRRRA